MSNPNSPVPQGGLQMPKFKNPSEMMLHEIASLMPVIQDQNFQAPRLSYPEERFTKYFAPFFLGVFEVPAGENIQTLWISEVGSLHTEVSIVDAYGKELFIVPPMINLEGINLKISGTSKVRFAALNQRLEEDSRNFPELARARFHQGLSQKLSSVFRDNRTDPSHVDKWLKIFEYYNVAPPSDPQHRVVPNVNYQTPGAPTPVANHQDWSSLGELDFTPSFD